MHLKNFVSRMTSESSTTGTQIKSEMETPSHYVFLLRLCPRHARCIVCSSTCTARTYHILVSAIAVTHEAVRKVQLEVPSSANSTPRENVTEASA